MVICSNGKGKEMPDAKQPAPQETGLTCSCHGLILVRVDRKHYGYYQYLGENRAHWANVPTSYCGSCGLLYDLATIKKKMDSSVLKAIPAA